ncbi:TrmH family RNA methyltransferase [Plantactinospora sp. KLBMP9567]|uniref:TrmH family RNA methyltransferase n=1 Tax=Plantactinospora sp. KLBMP9567 TaxID=3085900 RepID=UPI0029821D86|nr:TrmH family RNA methyltransferase [Plantactinospora sp. KLBMP9567]MDW5323638.1 TrmH family RNA methyltransferase [Plantactinospora sp. KLBMP9567]
MASRARLVGDGLENPANAYALRDAAAMFGVPCLFRDGRGLAGRWSAERAGGPLDMIGSTELLDPSTPIVAVENAPGATSVFGTAPPAGRPSIVVGNERLGVRPDVLRSAARCVQIPMAGRGVNTLNVASAAAVALHYLVAASGRRTVRGARPESRRPAVLLLGPGDHVEAGSTLRSAAAFGWQTVGLDDRAKVWWGTPRPVRTEARAAARSSRNPLRVVPVPAERPVPARRVVVAGLRVAGPPLHRVDLTGGPETLLVIPDEEATGPAEDWRRLGPRVEFARLEVPAAGVPYRYRLVAAIVLAEVARQLGTRASGRTGPAPRHRPRYDSSLTLVDSPDAELVIPAELEAY